MKSGTWWNNADTLKLDYDGPRLAPKRWAERLERAGYTVVQYGERRSPSGRGWHVWVQVAPAPESAVEVVALQLLLGSDPLREAYCVRRARQVDDGTVSPFWRTRWNVLYRRAPGERTEPTERKRPWQGKRKPRASGKSTPTLSRSQGRAAKRTSGTRRARP